MCFFAFLCSVGILFRFFSHVFFGAFDPVVAVLIES